MQNHVYKVVELVGSSPDSVEDAISAAIQRAGESLRNMRWFEVAQIRGGLEKGAVSHYQVVLKVGFTLDREDE
ncbi:dodecin family protein [Methylocystis sp. WRRC1]|uniref:dodecin n=1 Tax=unclassified Methylocystis TaxID=2625913 RepID=UPI0001F86F44|nr:MULTISPECIES: dodecin [unclassified Methylocystis]MCC3244492.1 dodecin family protein [Methylocystis sp. WRRC1]